MNARQRERAGRAVADRMTELAIMPTTAARSAGISTKTLRALIRGERWLTEAVQERIEHVLRWASRKFATRAVVAAPGSQLDRVADVELAAELLRRLEQRDRQERTHPASRGETRRPR